MAVVFLLFIAIFPLLRIIKYMENVLQQHGTGRYGTLLWTVYVLLAFGTITMVIYMTGLLMVEMASSIGGVGAGVGPT